MRVHRKDGGGVAPSPFPEQFVTVPIRRKDISRICKSLSDDITHMILTDDDRTDMIRIWNVLYAYTVEPKGEEE